MRGNDPACDNGEQEAEFFGLPLTRFEDAEG